MARFIGRLLFSCGDHPIKRVKRERQGALESTRDLVADGAETRRARWKAGRWEAVVCWGCGADLGDALCADLRGEDVCASSGAPVDQSAAKH